MRTPTPEEVEQGMIDFYRRNMDVLYGVRIEPRQEVKVDIQQFIRTSKKQDERVEAVIPPPFIPLAPAPPKITSLDPAYGSVDGGTLVTLTGTGLVDSNLVITFVYRGADLPQPSIRSISDDGTTVIFYTAPSIERLEKTVDVRVETDFGEDTKIDGYQYFVPLSIYLVDPNYGGTSGGYQVVIYGEGFLPNDLDIFFGDTYVGDLVLNEAGTIATVQSVPAHAEGTVDVKATSRSKPTEYTLHGGFTYNGSSGAVIAVDWNAGEGWRILEGRGITIVPNIFYHFALRALDSFYHINTGFNDAMDISIAFISGPAVVFITPPTINFSGGLSGFELEGVFNNTGDLFVGQIDVRLTYGSSQFIITFDYLYSLPP